MRAPLSHHSLMYQSLFLKFVNFLHDYFILFYAFTCSNNNNYCLFMYKCILLFVLTLKSAYLYPSTFKRLLHWRLKPRFAITCYNWRKFWNTHVSLGIVKRKVLVLDLDETLIHSHHDGVVRQTVRPGTPPDFVLKVVIDRHPVRFFVHKRPHVDFFLDIVSVLIFV